MLACIGVLGLLGAAFGLDACGGDQEFSLIHVIAAGAWITGLALLGGVIHSRRRAAVYAIGVWVASTLASAVEPARPGEVLFADGWREALWVSCFALVRFAFILFIVMSGAVISGRLAEGSRGRSQPQG